MKHANTVNNLAAKLKIEKKCFFCGYDDTLTVDHINPRSRGGPNHRYNKVILCRRCNAMKAQMTVDEFFTHIKNIIHNRGFQLIHTKKPKWYNVIKVLFPPQ